MSSVFFKFLEPLFNKETTLAWLIFYPRYFGCCFMLNMNRPLGKERSSACVLWEDKTDKKGMDKLKK